MTKAEFDILQARVKKKRIAKTRESGEKKRHKYNARAAWVDGVRFDSVAESRYYERLKLFVAAGELLRFHMQVNFVLAGPVKVRVDFMEIYPDGKIKYVDVKGVVTKSFIRNRKMIKAVYGVDIIPVKYKNGCFIES